MKKRNKWYKYYKYYALILLTILIIGVVFYKDIINLTINLTGFTVFQNKFSKNLGELNSINSKYNTNLYTFPLTIEKGELLLEDLNGMKDGLSEVPEPFKLLLDIRIKLVESDIYFKEGWKYGKGSTTKYGFGCKKGLQRLRNATFNRNMSSQIGYAAVSLMKEIIEEYPKEAEIANITSKHVLFLNATFYQEQKDAVRDR